MEKLATPNIWSKEELRDAAARDFGETEEKMASSMANLREWIDQSPHLRNIRRDDQILKQFLRGCKFSLERSKEKLDNFHLVKGALPEWFDRWDPSEPGVAELLKQGVYLPLPGYDEQGRFVVLCSFGRINPSKVRSEDLVKASNMVIGCAMEGNEQASVRGFVMVNDLSGVKSSHLGLLGPATVKKLITMMETAWPMRPQAVHLLNPPSMVEGILSLVKSLQKEKMRQRMMFTRLGTLQCYRTCLGRREYGGIGCSRDDLTRFWREEVERRRPWLMEQCGYKTNEALRPGRPKSSSDLFGIEGSFRKLEID